jgi:hypothetical protein
MKHFKEIFLCIIVFLLLNLQFDINFYLSLGIVLFIYNGLKLIINCNDYFPFIELMLSLFGLQYLIGPAIIYLNEDLIPETYKMKVSSDIYFSYIIPIYLAFSLGLNAFIKSKKLKIDLRSINQFFNQNKIFPYILISIGLVFTLVIPFLPSALQFVAYLLSSLKFIGVFIFLLSKSNKSNKIILFVFSLIVISSFVGGMFHDLLIWIIFLCLLLCLKYRPSLKFKFTVIIILIAFVVMIQSIKGAMRLRTWFGNETMSIGLLVSVIKDVNEDKDGIYNIENLPILAIRINQGMIVSLVMENVPSIVKHTNGELTNLYFQSAFLPRFLRKYKSMAGDQKIFTKFSGKELNEKTAMALGLFSDAYIEFGRYGAIIYIFIFGAFYSFILKKFLLNSKKYPILFLFILIAFNYVIRPDNETQTAIAHLFKSIFLIYFGFKIFKNWLILKTN